MNRLLIFLIMLFAITLLLSSMVLAQPKMYIPSESFDFGYTPQNCKVSHVFWIKSVGSDSLKIIDIKPG